LYRRATREVLGVWLSEGEGLANPDGIGGCAAVMSGEVGARCVRAARRPPRVSTQDVDVVLMVPLTLARLTLASLLWVNLSGSVTAPFMPDHWTHR
jgi:hypothetical protein